MDPSRLGLPRARRLRESRDFNALRQSGRRAVSGCLIVNWRTLTTAEASRAGVIASRRIGSAVVRNRAKRLLRETFRLHQQDLVQPVEAVLIARSSIVGRKQVEVERDFLKVLSSRGLLRQR